MLTLAQLLIAPTLPQNRAQVLASLRGIGFVVKTGVGTGSVTADGQGTITASVVIKITIAGELGTGSFQYSTDGGTTYSSNLTIPAGATYSVGTTGAVITFVAGPLGGGTSFALGDFYGFPVSSPNFPVTSWGSGGVGRTLSEVEAQALTDLGSTIPNIAAGGLLQSFLVPTTPPTPDGWMDLLGVNVYALSRNPAVATIGAVQLYDAANAGPFTIGVGQMTFSATNGQLYTNTTGGVLAHSGTLALTVQALVPGAAGNVGLNQITAIVAGVLPGVTVTNPGTAGVWISISGVDTETSLAYATRCQNRWPSLGIGATAATYDYWARAASPNVTKTRVIVDPTVPGQVDMWIAGAAGPVSGADVTAVQNYINARVPLGTTVLVSNSVAVSVAVVAAASVKAAQHASAVTAAANNLAAYIQAMPISDGTTVIDYEVLTSQIGSIPGVVRLSGVTVNAGTADITLTLGRVATLGSVTITWTDV
jgi:hypothetical protein